MIAYRNNTRLGARSQGFSPQCMKKNISLQKGSFGHAFIPRIPHKNKRMRLDPVNVMQWNENSSRSIDGLQDPSKKSKTIYPWDRKYQAWSTFATAAAAITGFIIPIEVAFGGDGSTYDFAHSFVATFDLSLVLIFTADIFIQSRVASFDAETGLTDDTNAVRTAYMSSPNFALDLLGCLPLDYLALAAIGGVAHCDPTLLHLLPILKLLHLVRLYRVNNLVTYFLFNLNVPLLWVTVFRNLAIVLLITHWVACGFLWEAREMAFDPELLPGVDTLLMSHLGPIDQYITSLYWAVTTLSMVEANTIPTTMAGTESAAARASLFLLFNITLGSYILGTITLLVVKQDERTGKYRDQSANLRQFTAANRLPLELRESLQEHLRLHFDTSEVSDEQVLSVFPSAIRRRILRHLYLRFLRGSYLFQGAPQRLLDALLASARVEIFMPQVDIISAGDYVNDLLLLVSGNVEILRSSSGSGSKGLVGDGGVPAVAMYSLSSMDGYSDTRNAADLGDAALSAEAALVAARMAADGQQRQKLHNNCGGVHRVAGAGEFLGEAAFFTEVPQLESIKSSSVCRVLVITRAAYTSLERAFPSSCREVLEILKRNAEVAVEREFGTAGPLSTDDLDDIWAKFSGIEYNWASSELNDENSMASPEFQDDEARARKMKSDIEDWSPRQQQVMSNLLRIRACVVNYINKEEAERTAEFLYAASQGNAVKLREMLQQGCPPNSADYDNRCALELACAKGHVDCVSMLLAAGADVNQQDALGSCPLNEACNAGHDDIVGLLLDAGAKLTGDPIDDAARLCSCVFSGNLPLLRRLLRCGLAVSAGDYDRRTAAHIAAAEGNLQAIKLLFEEGADVNATDRWGFTPLDEAKRVGAGPVVRYLEDICN